MSEDPVSSIIRDFAVNLAATYFDRLVTFTVRGADRLLRGTPQERALKASFTAAFAAFLAEVGKGLTPVEVDAIATECLRFFQLPDVSDSLLTAGLVGRRPDAQQLTAQFIESGSAARLVNIRVDLERGLDAYGDRLAADLFDRATESGSAIFELSAMHRFEDIQRGLDRVEEHLITTAVSRPPLQKPLRVQHFTGRSEELAKLLDDLQPGKIVTLCGPGGMGKSALAAEAVWRLAPGDDPPDRFPDGVIFHTFYHQPAAGAALEAIARAYGVEPRPTPRDAARLALANRKALLILDGTEAADELDAVLQVAGSCGVLITTRRRADAPDEAQDLEPLPRAESLDLLRAWAGKYAANDTAANETVRLLGGLPLALFVVGRYLTKRKQQASEYVAWLKEEGMEALRFGERPSRSVPLLLARSLEQVSEMARTAFGVVGVLALAPFDAEPIATALEVKAGAAHRALGELVDYGLLLRPDERYQVTHTLAHGYARAEAAPDRETIGRLALYFAGVAEHERARGPGGYAVLDSQRAHIVAVQAAALTAGQWNAVRRISWDVREYLDLKGFWSERISVVRAGLDAARAASDRHDEVAFTNDLGMTYSHLGETRRSVELFEQCLAIAREIGDRNSEAYVLGNLGLAYYSLGEPRRAIGVYEQILVIHRQMSDRGAEAADLGGLGNAYAALGETRRAIELHKQKLAIVRELGDHRGEGSALGNLGNAYAALGETDRAIELFEQCLAIMRGISDRRGETIALGNLGAAYFSLGETRRAIEYHEQALAIARSIGDRRSEGYALGNLGAAYFSLGETHRAIELYEQALVVNEETGDRRGEGHVLNNLGVAYLSLGETRRVMELYEQVLVIARETGDRSGEGNALNNLGLSYAVLGETRRAIECLELALRIFDAIESPSAEQARGVLTHLHSQLPDPLTELLAQWPSVRSAITAACQGNATASIQLQPALEYLEEMPEWQDVAVAVRRLLNGERNWASLLAGLDETGADLISAVLQALASP